MDRSTVYSWLSHPGVIDVRRTLERPYRMEQFTALRWRVLEENTSLSGDRFRMLDGGRNSFPPVTFIGPAGETRFDAGAPWDELAGTQAVRPLILSIRRGLSIVRDLNTSEEDNRQLPGRFVPAVPVIGVEEDCTRFSPLFSMAYGDVDSEVKEFVEVAGDDGDDINEEFLMEEYDLEELDDEE